MKKPIRMCICCKQRDFKENLCRFKLEDMVFSDTIYGKGMYLCRECLGKEQKILQKSLSRVLKNNLDKSLLINELKEKFLYVRKN